MSDSTQKLQLPLLLPAQAQKHVTLNEALQRLDVITQLSAVSRQQSSPPGAAEDGDTYLLPASASGDWAGQDGRIAYLQDAVWQFLSPAPGWLAWVADEQKLVRFDGTGWLDLPAAHPDQVAQLGIGTGADAANPLTVSGPGTLLTHDGSDHRLTLNKAGAGDTASVVFQTNWSGRAEMGLAGSDDFQLKVSGDGSTFIPAWSIDNATGRVSFPNGGGAPNVAQVRNSDTTTDLNTVGFTAVPITGVTDMLDTDWFAVSGNGLQCLRAGRVRATVSLAITSNISRINLLVRFSLNGLALGGIGASGYIRNVDGHNQSSIHLTRYVDVAAGDVITVEAQQEAIAGLATMTDGNSILTLEQW